MSQHRGAIVKDEPQVLTPAIHGSKLTTRQGRLEKRSVLESTAGAKPASIDDVDAVDDSRNNEMFESGSNGLDLGELRHLCESLVSARRQHGGPHLAPLLSCCGRCRRHVACRPHSLWHSTDDCDLGQTRRFRIGGHRSHAQRSTLAGQSSSLCPPQSGLPHQREDRKGGGLNAVRSEAQLTARPRPAVPR